MFLARTLRQCRLAQQSLLTDVCSTNRFARTHTLPSTDNVGDPTAFWERKMNHRFDRMDYNQDGYICWKDFDAQMKYILVSHDHDEQTMGQITALFEDAWRRVWSFGMRVQDKKASRREFVHGYTHIIKRAQARQQLSATLEDLLGGCFDIFDDTKNGQRTGQMSKQDFVAYQMCWNLSAEEAEQLFHDITRPQDPAPGATPKGGPPTEAPTTHVNKQQYLHAAWDFYFRMHETKSIGKNFYGILRRKKMHLLV